MIDKRRIEELKKRPFAKIFPDSIELIKNGICPVCGREIGGFRNNISVDEYRISGMCQRCQDSVFGGK